MEGMEEEKLYFPLFKCGKRQKASLGQSVSTHIVSDCRFGLEFEGVAVNQCS